MKNIGAVLRELADGDWRENLRRADRQTRLQNAVLHILREDGFDEISCRAAEEGGELILSAAPAAAVILRQMQEKLLPQLQKDFPEIKRLRCNTKF